MDSGIRNDILRSNVNSMLGMLFIGSFALGAALLIWHAAFGYNPIAKALAAETYQDTLAH